MVVGRWMVSGGVLLAACSDAPSQNREPGPTPLDERVDAGSEGTSPDDTPGSQLDSGTASGNPPESDDDDESTPPSEPSEGGEADASTGAGEDEEEPPSGSEGGAASEGEGGAVSGGEAGDQSGGGGSAGAPDPGGGAAGAREEESEPIEWSDVVPTWTRVGPQTPPRELFSNEEQLGGFWETPSGDVLTSFRTSVTQPEEGIAIYDWHYTLRTIVGDTIQPVPEVDAGTCRYEDWPYGSCEPGPDPYEANSLVTSDGTILVERVQWVVADDTVHPVVDALDPATGLLSPVIEFPGLSMPEDDSYQMSTHLTQLADGTIALSTFRSGTTVTRTAVFDTTGELLAERDGFVFGQRWERFALFVGENGSGYNQRFDWWDPRTGASARAFGFPEVEGTPPAFRTFVTPVGNVVFPGFTHNDRLIQIDDGGVVVEDRVMPAWNFHGTLPDGRYLVVEDDEVLGYVLRVYDREGSATLLYDEATLVADAGWPAFGTDVSGTYPHPAPLEFKTVVDDLGTAYVGFVLQTDGDASQTYLAAFAASGEKLWGFQLERTGLGSCLPERVLSGRRLVVRCWGRYLRRFVILGE